MATIQQKSIPQPVKIKKFYGLNLTGETQLILGESPNMTNYFITENHKLEKMYGYMKFLNTTKPIKGMWYGELNNEFHFLIATDGHIYKIDNDYWSDEAEWDTDTFTTHCTDLGTLTNATTRFLPFAGKVYILNGAEYKSWAGTSTIADVVGYIPKILISGTPSTGAGTSYDALNLLTGKKRMTFNGDGTATYKLPETSLTSVDSVYVGGVLKTVTTHYTVDLTTGVVTFTAGNFPTTGLDNVEIYWTKGTGDRDKIVKHKELIAFGPNNDTRVFLYGNPTEQNRIRFSDLADGVPSAEYFPSIKFNDVGVSNSAVTNISKQQSRMIISKDDNKSFYSNYESVEINGVTIVSFPVFPLNDTVGNVALGQGQVIDNKPVVIDKGLQVFNTTTVRDERNVDNISEKIWFDLEDLTLENAITYDYEEEDQYWLIVGNKLYIWHYGLSDGNNQQRVFSRHLLADNITCFFTINGILYMGTDTGKVVKFSQDFVTFDGTTINAYFESGFIDFGAISLKKTLNKIWVAIQPQTKASATFNYITDKEYGLVDQTITSSLALLEINKTTFILPNWSFRVNFNPTPFRLKLKAKKFSYLKMVIKNSSSTETCKILEVDMQVELGSESK